MPRQIVQGNLNRAAVSLRVISDPSLNITADTLGEEMISISYSGELTTMLPTATGVVGSPNPYIQTSITFKIPKTNGLCQRWLNKIQSNSIIGDIEITTDSSALDKETHINTFVQTFDSRAYNGKEPCIGFTIVGYLPENNDMFG